MNQESIDQIIRDNKLHPANEDSRIRPESTPTALFEIFPKENRDDICVYTNDAHNNWLLVDQKSGQTIQYWRR
jgi:hypothetical protein